MKILVELEIPALEQVYDVWIPDDLMISQVIRQLAAGMQSLSDEEYVSSGAECLCRRKGSQLLKPSLSLRDYEIRSGDHLLLI